MEETPELPALSLNDVLADLKGFGIEDFEETLTLESKGKQIRLRLSNITTEQERLSLLAHEEAKGYEWMQRVRIEILSRSISWINGMELRNLTGAARLVADPHSGELTDIQVVLRNILANWGQEHIMILWRVLMVHSQSIEDRLYASFPEAAVMTAVQRRFEQRAWEEIEEQTKAAIGERVNELFDEQDTETTKQS